MYFGSLPKNCSVHLDLRITEEKYCLPSEEFGFYSEKDGKSMNGLEKKGRYDLISIFKGSLFLICFK